MPPTRRSRFALVDMETGEATEPLAKTPHQFEGRGYSLQSMGAEVPLYELGLTSAEWSALDWIREHGGASAPIAVTPAALAADINTTATTAKTALGRLVKLALLLKPSPRAGSYQLTPRRYWEGAGNMQLKAYRRLEPPRIALDAKATAKASKAADKAAQSKTPKARSAPEGNAS